jgi:hypothetical protein
VSAHASRSPSKRYRFRACPGSIREEEKYPEQPSGPAAIDGTHSHTLLEACIKEWLADPRTFIGKTLTDHEGDFVVDEARAERVEVAISYIRERIFVLQMQGEHPQVVSEQRVDPAPIFGRDDMGGTVDCQIITPTQREIIDYKDGMADAWDSAVLQMEQYAYGALAVAVTPWPYQSIRLTVIQPKLRMKGGDAIRTEDRAIAWFTDNTATLISEAAATDDPDAPLVPGESQCKFCRAKGACSALASNVMSEVGIMFSPIAASPLDIAQQSADKDPKTMTDDQIVKIMEAAPLMRTLLDGVHEEAQRRLRAGQTINGLKLVNGRGTRSWRYSDEEMEDKLKRMGVPKSALYVSKFISPAQAEKLKWEKGSGDAATSKTLSERQLKTMESEFVSKTYGEPIVALASDSRAAVTVNAAPLFGAVENLPSWLTTQE